MKNDAIIRYDEAPGSLPPCPPVPSPEIQAEKLRELLLDIVDEKLAEIIVTALTEDATDEEIPSARAVWGLKEEVDQMSEYAEEAAASAAAAAESAEDAETAQSAAEDAAAAAASSATAADASADAAAGSATDAASSATDAAEDATAAAGSATSAAGSATAAAASATQAATAKTVAETAKTAAETAQAAAEAAATAAAGSATGAAASEAAAAASAAAAAATFETDPTLSISGKAADAKKTGDELTNSKTALAYFTDESGSQFPGINGVILPPQFAVGSRYVQNGADKWAENSNRLSFKKGTFIKLKAGDVVTKSAEVYTFSGGYSTDNGATFSSISNGFGPYTAPADGLYFFNLVKPNSGTYTDADALNGWKYISFFRSGNLNDRVTGSLALVETDIDNIQDAIGYAIAPVAPTEYYEMIPDTGLNYLGAAVTDANQEASDFISLDNLYDVCRVVTNKTVYGLGSICYYTEAKSFIRRDQPGTSYVFSIYNGETVVWLSIDKTVPNAKYIRFCANDSYGFKYWVVENAPQATVLDKYSLHPFYGKKIVNFGDSIFGNTRPPKDVSSYLAEDTGATVYNCGFGGCEMSEHASSDYTPFSMFSLADAIATGTWTAQEAAAALSGMPSYFAETVALLKSLDFAKIDIVTISYGTNDWNNSSPLDNGGNSNMAYYADALRYSIETLLTGFPNLRIFICTPIYRFWMDAQGQFTEDSNTKVNATTGKKLTDFVEKTIEVAKQYGLPYINDYEIGMNRYNRSYYFPATDGTHPNPKGNKLIADNIANKIY